jgi:hypothetical protein
MSHESASLLTKSVLNPSSFQMDEPTAIMTKSTPRSRFAKSNFRKAICSHCFLVIQLRNAIRYMDFHLDSNLPKINHTHHLSIQLTKSSYLTNTHHLSIQPTKSNHHTNTHHLSTQPTKSKFNNPILITSTTLIQ